MSYARIPRAALLLCRQATGPVKSSPKALAYLGLPQSHKLWSGPMARPYLSSVPAISGGFLIGRRSLFVQTQSTPNPQSLKFLPGVDVMDAGQTAVFNSQAEASVSPLARALFRVPGIEGVMFGKDFITVTKSAAHSWPEIKADIFAEIMDHFSSGSPLFLEKQAKGERDDNAEQDSEAVQMIKELLETRIRPVVQEDGGDVEYVRFEEGVVYLKLLGACGTCPSSTATLKGGIENMLMHYCPEVQSVEQEIDELERVGLKAFSDLERHMSP